jgi:hypothetical protein
MGAEPANEASVAWHLACRKFLIGLAGFQPLKSEQRFSSYGQKHGRLGTNSRLVERTPAACANWAPGKTKVWGSANQYDVQINLRRMEQFVLVDLCCHSWLEPEVAADRRLQ